MAGWLDMLSFIKQTAEYTQRTEVALVNLELRAMRGARSYLRHEVIRQLTSEFDVWDHEIDKDYFVRKCQQHCEYFFMSKDEAELTSWTEWRYIMAEVMSYAEVVTNK